MVNYKYALQLHYKATIQYCMFVKAATIIIFMKIWSFFFSVIYERTNRSVVLTNIVSAMWHGFYPGYYLAYLVGILGIFSGRKVHVWIS